MIETKPYSCPNCGSKFPIKHIFLLNNKSAVKCTKCNRITQPEKMGNWYIVVTFVSLALPGKISLAYNDSFMQAISIGMLFGLITYFVIIFFIFLKKKYKIFLIPI